MFSLSSTLLYLFQSMILIISCHDIVQMPIQIYIPLHMFSTIIIVEKLAFKSHVKKVFIINCFFKILHVGAADFTKHSILKFDCTFKLL